MDDNEKSAGRGISGKQADVRLLRTNGRTSKKDKYVRSNSIYRLFPAFLRSLTMILKGIPVFKK